MNKILFIINISIWAVGLVIYLRSCFLAQGKIKNKFFKKDTFQFGQAVAAIVFSIGLILAFIFWQKMFIWVFAINFVLNFLFYLQPTPRTTTAILKLSAFSNVVLTIIIICSLF